MSGRQVSRPPERDHPFETAAEQIDAKCPEARADGDTRHHLRPLIDGRWACCSCHRVYRSAREGGAS